MDFLIGNYQFPTEVTGAFNMLKNWKKIYHHREITPKIYIVTFLYAFPMKTISSFQMNQKILNSAKDLLIDVTTEKNLATAGWSAH